MVNRKIRIFGVLLLILISIGVSSSAAPVKAASPTDTIHVVRYASDNTTILAETTIDCLTMESTLPVYGDGITHYYHQGPNFSGGDLWDPTRTINLRDREAVKGTAVSDLCNLVGGAADGDKIGIKAIDGMQRKFVYRDVYYPDTADLLMTICWYKNGVYSPGYDNGLRLVFMTQNTNGSGQLVFGNTDMKLYLDESSWYFYGGTKPSSDGLSVKWVSEIIIYSNQVPPADPPSVPYDPGGAPKFYVTGLSVSPSEVFPGENVSVSANVYNGGDMTGTFTTDLLVNGQEQETYSVEVATGQSVPISFVIRKQETGKHVVKLEHLSSTFSVIPVPDIDESGVFSKTVTYRAPDKHAEVTCTDGTLAVTADGNPVDTIYIAVVTGLPRPSCESSIVSNAYNFGPDGTVFDKPVTIRMSYDEADIPDGVDETALVAGCLQTGAVDWEFIEEVTIDSENNTVSLETDHFTIFAVFATIPEQEEETVPSSVETMESTDNVSMEPPVPSEEETDDTETESVPVTPVVVTTSGATSSVSIVRYAVDGTTILDRRRVDYIWMKENLPVKGDGVTHYYHQGPVFEGDMWDPGETVNLKDKGPVMGTSVKDLCDLLGGMEPGNEVMLCAVDGYNIKLGYEQIYEPAQEQGQVVLCWYRGKDEDNTGYGYGYPANNAFSEALQIVFMAGTANENGQYVFGNTDMRQALSEEKYQHFYEGLPSTNGLCGKWISEIRIITGETAEYVTEYQPVTSDKSEIPWLPILLGSVGGVLVLISVMLYRRKKHVETV
ncbi:MAG: hypothetical protein JW712_02735 [Dehalococcoidales bacterium]|nr:hypothetical protein [Dehalococcoidales bacterium]